MDILIQTITWIIRRKMVPPKQNYSYPHYGMIGLSFYDLRRLDLSTLICFHNIKNSSYPSLTIIRLKCLCTPDGVALLLIIFGYMNKSVLTALVVMPAIAASSLVSVTFANTSSTDSPSAKSDTNKSVRSDIKLRWNHNIGIPMMHGMKKLTDAEKTSLESMTDAQKKEFFQKKMDEQKANMDARDTVIDKLLNGENLSDSDKTLVTEMKTERAKMKANRAQMENIRAKLDKKETLTSEEQTFLDAHQPKGNERGHRWDTMKSTKERSSEQ